MDTVGLAMIVRDAQETLAVALESAQQIFDQIVVVDTGSVDATPEIARKYGAEVYSFQWIDDFAAARNASFDALKTEWAFWLDADDMLVGREYFEEMLAKAIDKKVDGVILEYLYALDAPGQKLLAELEPAFLRGELTSDQLTARIKPWCTTAQYRERLVKRIPGWRWLYPIHEALPAAGHPLGKYDQMRVIHRRHVKTQPVQGDRNLRILEKIPKQFYDERIHFYFGLEYVAHNRMDDAIRSFEEYLRIATIDEEKYLATCWLGDIYRSKGDNDRAITLCLQAVQARPGWRDAYVGLLRAYSAKQEWGTGAYYASLAASAEVPNTPYAFNPMDEEIGWVGDAARCLVGLGRYDEAMAVTNQGLAKYPNNPPLLANQESLAISLNLDRGRAAAADLVEFLIRHDSCEAAAVVLHALPSDMGRDARMKELIGTVSLVCENGSADRVAGERLQPEAITDDPTVPHEAWADHRVQHLWRILDHRIEIQSILQVGGPYDMAEPYMIGGKRVKITHDLRDIQGQWDAVILWNVLELVRNPEEVVEAARKALAPEGWLIAFVGNGPRTKGVGLPARENARLRAFSIDTARQVLGTVRIPDILGGGLAEGGDMVFAIPMGYPPGPSRKIAIACPRAPELWGPESLGTGIGGSEEAVIRLSRAFARRGHSVRVYGSGLYGPDLVLGDAITYAPLSTYSPADVLIGWRHPELFVNQVRPLEAGWRALWLHDSIDKERVEAASGFVDAIWAISNYHAWLYAGVPRVYVGRNGIDPDDINAAIAGVERNSHKVVYVSSPVRGLDTLLEFWPQIRARVPDAELHVFYGWASMEALGHLDANGQAFKARVEGLCEQPGVVWRGRVGQQELYREMASAGVWAYPSRWTEEHCISAYIAQACGTWPVVYPLGALPQSVVFGTKTDEAHFVDSVVAGMSVGEPMRAKMAAWICKYGTWDECASLWERLWRGKAA